jgi:hypothetical protein
MVSKCFEILLKPGMLKQLSTFIPAKEQRGGMYHKINKFNSLPMSATSASRPALGPTQPPVQCVLGALSAGVKRGRGVMLTTHPLLVPRVRKGGSYTSSHPNAPVWSVTGPL